MHSAVVSLRDRALYKTNSAALPGCLKDSPTLHTPRLQSTEIARRITHTRHPHHLSQIENT
jgi:hypothetical protein